MRSCALVVSSKLRLIGFSRATEMNLLPKAKWCDIRALAVSAFGTTQAIGGNPQLISEGYARAELISLKVSDKQPSGLGQHDICIYIRSS